MTIKSFLTILILLSMFAVGGCATWEQSVSAIATSVTPEDQKLFEQGIQQFLAEEETTHFATLFREMPESPWSAEARKALDLRDRLEQLKAKNVELEKDLAEHRRQLTETRKKQTAQADLLQRQKRYIQKLKDLIVDSEIQQIK